MDGFKKPAGNNKKPDGIVDYKKVQSSIFIL